MSAPVRRTQAERTAETRRRILDAVVESIAEVGFQRTTATEIVRRAGVTWGAVQHHFGAKGGILEAVLEDTFERFEACVGDISAEAALARRVSLFIERAWQHFSSPHFRSTFEILLHHGKNDDGEVPPHWQETMFRAFDRVFERLFSGSGLPRRERAALHQYAVAELMGLSALEMLDTSRPRAAQLALLERTLLRELGG
jgi:AcrR family transcriptional regulator